MTAEIVSPSNQRIKRLVRLRDRRHRDSEGVFIAEGRRAVGRAIESGFVPRELYYVGPEPPYAADSAFSCSVEALARASYRSRPDEVLAVFDQFDTSIETLAMVPEPLYLAAENLEKPGNLGAMLRTADAVAASGFIAIDSQIDIFNPNVVRSSTGTLFTIPLAQVSVELASDWFNRRGIKVLAASPDARGDLWHTDLSGPIVLLIGTEDRGLSDTALSMADELVRIPMSGVADSLNASVALAVLAYEAVRQRR